MLLRRHFTNVVLQCRLIVLNPESNMWHELSGHLGFTSFSSADLFCDLQLNFPLFICISNEDNNTPTVCSEACSKLRL